MEFKIWDKKESINGVSASTILSKHTHFKNSEVVLFVENNIVTRIEDINILKNVYGIEETDALKIAEQAYLKMKGDN